MINRWGIDEREGREKREGRKGRGEKGKRKGIVPVIRLQREVALVLNATNGEKHAK